MGNLRKMSLHTQVTPIAGDRRGPEEDIDPVHAQGLCATSTYLIILTTKVCTSVEALYTGRGIYSEACVQPRPGYALKSSI